MLGPLEWYVTPTTPTLDAALLISSRAGADLSRMSDRLEFDAFLGERERSMLIETRFYTDLALCNGNCDIIF